MIDVSVGFKLVFSAYDCTSDVKLCVFLLKVVLYSRDVQKTKIWFGFVFLKNQTIQKFDICSDGFLIETALNLSFK